MAFSNDTLILTPDGAKKINSIKSGENIVAQFDDGTWRPRKVHFSAGTKSETSVFFIHYGDNQQLIATKEQLFLLSTDHLKAAKELLITDQLCDKLGHPVEIKEIYKGTYNEGIQTIACSEHPTEIAEGHLILCNGIIVGDYALERGCQVNTE